MVEGGATNAGNSEYLAQGLAELIQGNEEVKKAAEEFLKSKEIKDVNLADPDKIIELLGGDNGKEFLETISKKLSEEEIFKRLAEQIGKDRVMMEKLEALGNQLSTQGIINAAAFATLTGALAGTLAIGGVTGALAGGGIALLGFLAIVAIAAIGYAVYKHRGEIKEGAIDAGKAIKSFVKNLIDQLPTIQARENNFSRLKASVLTSIIQIISEEVHTEEKADAKIKKEFVDKEKIVKILQDKEQRSAIKELIKDGTIKGFSKEDMDRLVGKGLSTHGNDMEALEDLMKEFLPKIMVIGNDKIEEVEKMVNDKVKPGSQVGGSSSEQVAGTGENMSP
ncbi:MAG: hypothetical protein ACR5K9_05140 [Wolbachia sp.]